MLLGMFHYITFIDSVPCSASYNIRKTKGAPKSRSSAAEWSLPLPEPRIPSSMAGVSQIQQSTIQYLVGGHISSNFGEAGQKEERGGGGGGQESRSTLSSPHPPSQAQSLSFPPSLPPSLRGSDRTGTRRERVRLSSEVCGQCTHDRICARRREEEESRSLRAGEGERSAWRAPTD